MKYKLTDDNKELIENVQKECLSKYKIDYEDYIEIDELFYIIDDMLSEIHYLQDEIKDLEHDSEGNLWRV